MGAVVFWMEEAFEQGRVFFGRDGGGEYYRIRSERKDV